MKQRTLGDELTVSAIGLGCMSITGAHDVSPPDAAAADVADTQPSPHRAGHQRDAGGQVRPVRVADQRPGGGCRREGCWQHLPQPGGGP